MSLYQKIKAHAYARNLRAFKMFYDNDELDLNPPYQRGAVWSVEQKRNLWKSLIMGLPVGSIFLNLRTQMDGYVVVDGQQRIRAILGFLHGEFAIPAAWLEPRFVSDGSGDMVTWSELSDIGRRVLGNGLNPISCYESSLPTAEEEAELYLLINFGGVEQTAEDQQRAEKVSKGEPLS